MKKTTVRTQFTGFVKLALFAILFAGLSEHKVYAFEAAPNCLDNSNRALPEMDAQVLAWKKSTRNQFMARAHVAGILKTVYPNMNGHNHFSISLGQGQTDTLEVIYNIEFGKLPNLAPGMQVEACGDYITSTRASGGNRASPDGAIIHWIHQSDNNKHKSGYVSINGVVYGIKNQRR